MRQETESAYRAGIETAQRLEDHTSVDIAIGSDDTLCEFTITRGVSSMEAKIGDGPQRWRWLVTPVAPEGRPYLWHPVESRTAHMEALKAFTGGDATRAALVALFLDTLATHWHGTRLL